MDLEVRRHEKLSRNCCKCRIPQQVRRCKSVATCGTLETLQSNDVYGKSIRRQRCCKGRLSSHWSQNSVAASMWCKTKVGRACSPHSGLHAFPPDWDTHEDGSCYGCMAAELVRAWMLPSGQARYQGCFLAGTHSGMDVGSAAGRTLKCIPVGRVERDGHPPSQIA